MDNTKKTETTKEDLKEKLRPEQYQIMCEGATEPAFTGLYWDEKGEGVYRCAACGAELFSSDSKFDSGTGWPSFYRPKEGEAVELRPDNSLGMTRTEVVCKNCGSHLGHLFEDAPKEHGGKRYCINSAALNLDTDIKG